VLDGVYRCDADELHTLLQAVIARLMKLLTRRGVLVEDMGQTCLAEPDTDGERARTLQPLQAAVTYRISFGPRAGQKVLTWTLPPGRCCERSKLLCSRSVQPPRTPPCPCPMA